MASKPVYQNRGGIHHFTWEEEKIAIRLDRLAEDSKQAVTAEITVTVKGEHIHQARVNLTSTTTRKTFANQCNSRVNTIDWDAVMENACITTLAQYRRGEPVITVGDLPDRDEPVHRVNPLLLEGVPTVMYGDGGVGKTFIADTLAVLIQCGVGILNWEPIEGNVLILDWENSEWTHDVRIKAIIRGLGITPHSLPFYRHCEQSITHDIAEIQSNVVDKNISVIILDSLGMACGGEPESARAMIDYFRALRSLRTTTLSIHHIAKESNGRYPYGSVYCQNYARSTFEIKHSQAPGDTELNIGIYHRKSNDVPKLQPMGIKMTFETVNFRTNKVELEAIDLVNIPELATGLPMKDRLKEALSSGSKNIDELSDELAISKDSITTTLYRHKDWFVRLAKGEWGLKSYEEEYN